MDSYREVIQNSCGETCGITSEDLCYLLRAVFLSCREDVLKVVQYIAQLDTSSFLEKMKESRYGRVVEKELFPEGDAYYARKNIYILRVVLGSI